MNWEFVEINSPKSVEELPPYQINVEGKYGMAFPTHFRFASGRKAYVILKGFPGMDRANCRFIFSHLETGKPAKFFCKYDNAAILEHEFIANKETELFTVENCIKRNYEKDTFSLDITEHCKKMRAVAPGVGNSLPRFFSISVLYEDREVTKIYFYWRTDLHKNRSGKLAKRE